MDLGYRADDILWLVEQRPADARLSVVELPDRPRAGARLRRPAVPVRRHRGGARGDGRRARRRAGAQDRGARELPHPRLVRERLPPHLQQGAAGAHARRPRRACASACCRARCRSGPSSSWARCRCRMDLTEAIAGIKAGTLDAQENPLSNTVTYGVHKFHRFHTLSNHFYISRPIFLHRDRVRRLAGRPAARDARGGDGGDRVPARPARAGRGGRAQGDRGGGLRDRRADARASTTRSRRR